MSATGFSSIASSREVLQSTLSPAFPKSYGSRKPPTMTSRWRPRLRHEAPPSHLTFTFVISPGNLHQTPAVSVKQHRLIPGARRPLPPYSPPKYLPKSNTGPQVYLGSCGLPGDVSINLIVLPQLSPPRPSALTSKQQVETSNATKRVV